MMVKEDYIAAVAAVVARAYAEGFTPDEIVQPAVEKVKADAQARVAAETWGK